MNIAEVFEYLHNPETCTKPSLTSKTDVQVMITKLSYQNYSDKESLEMAEALTFWRSLREIYAGNFSKNNLSGTISHQRISKEFILEYVDGTQNPFLSLVAHIEMLPTEVMHRMFRHYNIDFASYESCLRRLWSSKDQVKGVFVTYNALFRDEAEMPPCYIDGYKNKLKAFAEIIPSQVQDICWESDEAVFVSSRYNTQIRAILYDFGMDVGYVLYPNKTEDTKLGYSVSTQLGKMLTQRSEDKQFELNKEDGIYVRILFELTRSNAIWRSDATVKLGQWFCPGFLVTLILLALYFIVSPLCAYLSYISFTSHGPWYLSVLLAVPGSVIFIILLVTGIYKLYISIEKESITNFDKEADEHWDVLWTEAKFTSAYSVVLAVLIAIAAGFFNLFYESHELTGIYTLVTVMWFVSMRRHGKFISPWDIGLPWKALSIFLGLYVLVINTDIAISIWSFIALNYLVIAFTLLLAFFIIAGIITIYTIKQLYNTLDTKMIDTIEEIYTFIVLGLMIVCLLLTGGGVLSVPHVGTQLAYPLFVLIGTMSVAVFGTLYAYGRPKQMVSTIEILTDAKIKNHIPLLKNVYESNFWLATATRKKRNKALKTFETFLTKISQTHRWRASMFLIHINAESIHRLEQLNKETKSEGTSEQYLMVLEQIISGKSLAFARKETLRLELQKKAPWPIVKLIQKIWSICTHRVGQVLSIIWVPIACLYTKILSIITAICKVLHGIYLLTMDTWHSVCPRINDDTPVEDNNT